MAAVASSRQPPAPFQQPTPPSSSHGGAGSWDFAVPLDNSRISYDQGAYMPGTIAPTDPYAAQHTVASHTHGFVNSPRSTTWESQSSQENEQAYRAHDRVDGLHNKTSGDLSAVANEKDSIMAASKSQSNNKMMPPPAKGSSKGKVQKSSLKSGKADPNMDNLEQDQSNWIHRDKLKEIEIREMEELGLRVSRSGRSASRSQSASRKSRVRKNSGSTERMQDTDDRSEHRRMVSPIPAGDEDALVDFHAQSPASEDLSKPPQTTHIARPSTSRIPLPGRSGIPVPASLADREAPLPRSRAGSASWNGDIAAAGARVRGSSFSSQRLLDEPRDPHDTTPPKGHRRNTSSEGSGSLSKSPQKSTIKGKTTGKSVPAPKTRKAGVPTNGSKNRQVSGNSGIKRPGTGGGSLSRPATSTRPEGEAPWIATMYKPDPRLPQDQQIIPTHAKKMQQEQWMSEGRVSTMYDTEFQPLNDDHMAGKRTSQPMSIDAEKAGQSGEWPLASPTQKPSLEHTNSLIKTPSSEQPGYKLTPTIPQSPRVPSPQPAPVISAQPSEPPKAVTTTRLPEPVEESEKQKKKSACCIVM